MHFLNAGSIRDRPFRKDKAALVSCNFTAAHKSQLGLGEFLVKQSLRPPIKPSYNWQKETVITLTHVCNFENCD